MRVGKQFEWKQYKILPKYYIRNQKSAFYCVFWDPTELSAVICVVG